MHCGGALQFMIKGSCPPVDVFTENTTTPSATKPIRKVLSKKTRGAERLLVWCWQNVADVGPIWKQQLFSVSWLMGRHRSQTSKKMPRSISPQLAQCWQTVNGVDPAVLPSLLQGGSSQQHVFCGVSGSCWILTQRDIMLAVWVETVDKI